ncbi:hypothetical protein TNCV_3251851 [Trichonephila clavipes]|nr:hypothetical protein TNCV_3251851 [Trichonephila clavipes]
MGLRTQRLLFKAKKKASSINSSVLFSLTGRKTRCQTLLDMNTSCASFRHCKRRGTVLEAHNWMEPTARFRWFIVSSMARISSPVAGCGGPTGSTE